MEDVTEAEIVTAATEPELVVGKRGRVGIARVDGHAHVYAAEPIAEGEVILDIEGEIVDRPTRYSIQIGPEQHVGVPRGISFGQDVDRYAWRFLNHSCEPNATVRGRQLVAMSDIPALGEVTFDYNTTERTMAEPFQCRCGASSCLGVIRGYDFLPDEQKRRIRAGVAAYLL